jgi:DNA-binding LytR/AlgR family response regulator
MIVGGYALVTAISTAVVGYLFPMVFKRFYHPDRWTYGKNILQCIFIVSVIGLGNFLFDRGLTDRPSDTFIPMLLTYLLITFLIGIIPAVVIVVLSQNRNLKRNFRDARELNRHLADSLKATEKVHREGTPVRLSGATKDGIELYPEDILYLEAAGNYILIHYKTAGQDAVEQKRLRATISQMEEMLAAYSFIVKCHRAFLVNLSYITAVEGNSQGLLLSLRHVSNTIPVSRTYTKLLHRMSEQA